MEKLTEFDIQRLTLDYDQYVKYWTKRGKDVKDLGTLEDYINSRNGGLI